MGQSTWGVTPRNSFSRETRTQDKADGQLQKRIFVNSLCAHSEGTHITSLKSCPKCEPSLSLHLLQALQPSSNLVQPQPERDLCRRSSWEGCLHWRRRQPSCLPGSVREVDCCWTCHLGCWMCKRCSWSLRQDVALHPVDK